MQTMNPPEAIAAAYLRLNGFFLLTNFTVFAGDHHRDIDIVAVRAPGAAEAAEGDPFLTDDKLLTQVADVEKWTAVVVQVKGGDEEAFPTDEDIRYVTPMVGGSATRITKIAFSNRRVGIVPTDEGVAIGLRYAIEWIWERIEGMDKKPSSRRLSKKGSWTWSDPTLAMLLVLCRFQQQE
jgi:hypothetical protein